jgi:sporulation protein YlmC with PRC-barrel domain
MLKVKSVSEVIGKKVYTSDGDFFGVVEEVNLYDNRIEGWKIRVNSNYANALGGARGVIIPHQFVKAIGDVFVINRGSLPGREESMDMTAVEGSMSDSADNSEELI